MDANFRDKKITVMGLGLLGRGIEVAKFLAEQGAKLTITDLKSETELASSVEELEKFVKQNKLSQINFALGGHRIEDFTDTDMVVRAPNAPLDSIYLTASHKAGVPVEMDASLFAKLSSTMFGTGASGVKIIGVTGTRGKTTTTHLIYEILKAGGKKVFIGGNVRDGATLPLLREISPTKGEDCYVVLELDSWQLQGFGESKISPHISVFTSFMQDHLNYYKGDMQRYFEDKSNIFKYQKKGDYLIISESLVDNYKIETSAEIHKVSERTLWRNVETKLLGAHNLENIACAVATAEIVGISKSVIKKVVALFLPVAGRLEPLGKKNGILFVNDNNSTTPEATIVAMRALGGNKNIILIFGGDDKKLDMSKLVEEIPKYCSGVVMFKERGTDTIRDKVFALVADGLEVYEEEGLVATFNRAVSMAKKGDTILFSPAFSSFGKYFKNEYDRGDQFTTLVKRL